MNKLKRITSMLLATIMIFGVMTVAPFTASAASYKDNFINALVNNQSSWNVPLFGDGKSMTTRIYFMDLNFDGDLELITDYNGGSGGVCVEVYGYKDGKLIHYNIDKNANLVDWFDCYYDTQENKYKVLGTDTTMFCYSSSASHKDKSNYEIVVINNTIYKDFYTCHCPIDGYYNLYRKGSPIDGYIEGAYNYNIGGPDSDSTFYNERNSERIKNCLKVNVTKKYINCSDWKNYSYTQKKKALQEAYDAFSYGVSPTSVKVNRSTLTLGVGESYGILKTVSPSNAKTSYTWSSSNSSVASVNSSGKVTAKKAGTANITVKTSNGKTATCKVTVKPAPTSVKISNLGLTLGKGETFIVSQSTNSGSYAWGFSWSSSNTSVATVAKTTANKAKITAKGTGTAIITIKTYNGKTATCKVTVKPAPTSVKTNPTSITLGKGETYTISESTNSGSYANAINLKWSSSNTSVATVTKGSGNKAKITA
ncbi:MAG: Ig-like domain-containing protein, partial [Ruminococcus sp.]|nr:Ig-like domain-containing protein [Ruminococcus sp.]